MYDPYAMITRLNAETLRRCEEHFLDPEHDRYAEDEENNADDIS